MIDRPDLEVSSIYRFIGEEAGAAASGVAAMTAIVGLLRAFIVYLIGESADGLMHGEALGAMPMLFCLCVVGLVALLYLSISRSVEVTETVAMAPAIRIAARVRTAELVEIDLIGRDRIKAVLTRDSNGLANTAFVALNAVQALAFIGGTWVLLTTASLFIGLAAGVVGWFAVATHARQGRSVRAQMERADASEDTYGRLLRDTLWGFKELRLNTGKRRDLLDNDLRPAIGETADQRRVAGRLVERSALTLIDFYFLALGFIVFVAAQWEPDLQIWTCVFLMAFVRANVLELASYLPILVSAGVAADRVRALEQRLGPAGFDGSGQSPSVPFTQLSLRGVTYTHVVDGGGAGFRSGPTDLDLPSGTITFLVGDNGSGKSTLLRLISGLYQPEAGWVQLDGRPLDQAELRGLFSAVFFDFHLLRELYGVGAIDSDTKDRLLRTFGLTGRVAIEGRVFSRTNLSSGQKRRLALIAALLENRPILLIDEWTADQSPEFRQFFFTELLPELKCQGTTIIAAVHDDRYFSCADQLVVLADGRVTRIERRDAGESGSGQGAGTGETERP